MKCKYIIITLLLFFAQKALCGTCTNITPQNSTISFGNITVQRDVAIGSVIFSQAASQTGYYLQDCTNPLNLSFTMVYNGAHLSPIGQHVYNTNLAGVGVRFSSGNYFDNPSTYFQYNTYGSVVSWFGGTVELVITGAPSSGQIAPGTLGTIGIQLSDSSYKVGLTTSITGGAINVVKCSISTPSLNFPIGNISASSFGSTVGTTPSGAQNTQNLGLNCDAGTNINVSLTGTQNPDVGTTSVLALTGQGNTDVAKGVGVQILYNGSPLVLNNRIVLKQSSGGQETFPLTARYYQTKTSVTPGTANASATLNLTYQ